MSGSWYYQVGTQAVGPVTLQELKFLIADGVVQRSQGVREGQNAPWAAAETVAGLCRNRAQSARTEAASGVRKLSEPLGTSALRGRSAEITAIVGKIEPETITDGLGAGRSQSTIPIARVGGKSRAGRHVPWVLAALGVVTFAAAAVAAFILVVVIASNWNTSVAMNDVPSIPPVVNEPAAVPTPASLPATRDGTSSMQMHFAQLAPAVPLVKNIGNGSGTGFYIKHSGRKLAVTNRHVVENSPNGIEVLFLKGASRKDEQELSIPKDDVRVVAIHRQADLVLLEIKATDRALSEWGVKPVSIAPKSYVASQGQHVFAIGHPGNGLGELLTRSISDGIISAVGHESDMGRAMQVTVPINFGNSGGPLFDDDGRVIGVNTFGFRQNRQGVALEALNFSLEVSQVYELLEDSKASLSENEIRDVLKPGESQSPVIAQLVERLKALDVQWRKQGYRHHGDSVDKAFRGFELGADPKGFPLTCVAGVQYVVLAAAALPDDIDLVIFDDAKRLIVKDDMPDNQPTVQFSINQNATVTVGVVNPTGKQNAVMLVIYEK